MRRRELRAIAERARRATPGPWTTDTFAWYNVADRARKLSAEIPLGSCMGCWRWRSPKGRLRGRRQAPLAAQRTKDGLQHLHSWRWSERRRLQEIWSQAAFSPVRKVRGWYDEGFSVADGEFIAHAREDIPRLLAEVHRLQLICR